MNLNNEIAEKSYLGIKASELKITLTAVAYFFFVISAYYVIKPIRGSLALELGSNNIPVLNILSMISLVIGNAFYSLIVGKYKRDIFIPFITKFFVICILGFWLIFSFAFPLSKTKNNQITKKITKVEVSQNVEKVTPKTHTNSIPKTICIGTYYLWVNLFALFAVSMFWSFMNDVFSVAQSKRLYAIIGYGGLVGGLTGGLITSLIVKQIGTQNLFVVAAILLYPSIWCMKYIHANHYKPEGVPEGDAVPEKPAHPPRPVDGFLEVVRAPVLIFMAFELLTYTFSSTMFFQELNIMVEHTFGVNLSARTAFIAGIYTKINAISLITQFFVTKLFMMFKNPIFGLLLINIIQVIGSILMLINPSLAIVSWAIIIRYALNYSTGRAIRELVYIPLSREQKYQGKGFIDTVIFRIGDGLSSVMLIGGMSIFGYGNWIDISVLISMAFQMFVIFKIASIYSKRTVQA